MLIRHIWAAALLGGVLTVPVVSWANPTLTTLYGFMGQPGGTSLDGYEPSSGVTLGPGGVLYGTTYEGGAAGGGTVYQLTPPATAGGVWTETILYSFQGGSLGDHPQNGVALGQNGALYGTTEYGGQKVISCPTQGCGTVFELTPPATPGGAWTHTVIYSFAGATDGDDPIGGLAIGRQGVIYGTTAGCGPACAGTAFELAPPVSPGGAWAHHVLHRFQNNPDGVAPEGNLVIGAHGELYGTTEFGGIANNGTVFLLHPPATSGGAWTETVLYSFSPIATGGMDGSSTIAGVVIGANGDLYGTTYTGGLTCGCGTVFQLAPPSAPGGAWTESIIYRFTGANGDGQTPFAGLVLVNGALYGTTYSGGTSGNGTIFRVTPPAAAGGNWTETVLYSFTGVNGEGAYPRGSLIRQGGVLYGTTQFGGSTGYGTVFALMP